MRRRSTQLRPRWMFRQVLDLPIEEMVRLHDEALFRLKIEGIHQAPPFPGSGLDAERYGNRKLQADVAKRWYLWAFRPLVARLSNHRRPLSEQENLASQIDCYRDSLKSMSSEP